MQEKIVRILAIVVAISVVLSAGCGKQDDNRETLETLKNDSRELQRALLEAGLNTDSGDLNFSLRGEEQQAQDDKGSSGRPLTGDEDIAELEEMIIEEAIIASDGRVITNGRIDVRA